MFAEHIESLMNKDTPQETKEKIVDAILQRTTKDPNEDILTKNKNLISALIKLLQQKEVTDTTKKNIAQIILNLTKTNKNHIKILNDNPYFGKILNDFLELKDAPPEARQYALKTLENFIPTLINLLQRDEVIAATKQQALRGILKLSEDANSHTVILKNHKNIIQTLMNNFIETHIKKITEITEATSMLAMKIIIKLVKLESPCEQYDEILENYRGFIPSLNKFLEDEKATAENKRFAIHLIHKLSPTLVLGLDNKNSKHVTEDDAAKALMLLATSSTNPEKILDRNPDLIKILIKLLEEKESTLIVLECAIHMLEKFVSVDASLKKISETDTKKIISTLNGLREFSDIYEPSKQQITTTIDTLTNYQGTKSTMINSKEGSNKRLIKAQEQEGNKKLKPNKFTVYLPENFKNK